MAAPVRGRGLLLRRSLFGLQHAPERLEESALGLERRSLQRLQEPSFLAVEPAFSSRGAVVRGSLGELGAWDHSENEGQKK